MQVMYDIVYNIITIIILLFILYKVKYTTDRQTNTILFINILWATALISSIVIASDLLVGRSGKIYNFIQTLLIDIRFGISGVIGCYWCIYIMCENPNRRRWLFMGNRYYIMHIPAFFLMIFSLESFFTGHIAYADPVTNKIMPGDYHFVQIAVTYFYFTAASFCTLIRLIMGKYEKRFWPTKLMFSFLPCLAGLAHLVIADVGFVWITLALLLMMEHMDFVAEQVSTDSLTRLNNRGAFDHYIKTALAENYVNVYLFMIDVDLFKQINDTYGHLEGDNALIETAKLLKLVCSLNSEPKSCFLARYGGDEFAIVMNARNPEVAEEFKEDIVRLFESSGRVESDGAAFKINISVGMARAYSEDEKELIASADSALYLEKKHNHQLLKGSGARK
ncbi:MAG: GGDEF domain-containing protein [Treponema sp.]|nr:GGDEF domain-containing protein [Treponema sp.]